MTITSLCRAARPLSLPLPVLQTCAQARSMGTLSGIHRGLRNSKDRNPRRSDSGLTYRQRQEARANAPAPPFTIHRGKKDVTEYPNKAPKAQTRAARFFDPESSFGKKSLVYQIKSGKIADQLGTDVLARSGKPLSSTGDVFSDKIRGFLGDSQEPGKTRLQPNDFELAEPRPDKPSSGSGGDSWGRQDSEPIPARSSSFSRGEGRGRDFGRSRDSSDRSRTADHSRSGRDFGGSRDGRSSGRFGGPREDRFSGRFGESRDDRFAGGFGRPRGDRASGRFGGPRDSSGGFGRSAEEDRSAPPFGASRDDHVSDRDIGQAEESTPSGERPFRPRSLSSNDFDSREHRQDMHPVSIPYTTAASQFLYGKSVVEAALRGARRKFYKLYIYRGRPEEITDRKRFTGVYQEGRTAQDHAIELLAQEHQVQVINLRQEDGLRMMNKMAGNRPHNNYVLEASPLPQLPVVSLGALSEPSPSDPNSPSGFHVSLAHQSAEEAAISGTSDFVATPPSTHKPLVVLLHGILDPGNVGALLRSLAFLGATAVVTTKRGSASLTPVALKSAAGASETMTLLSVDSAERFLDESRAAGWVVYAAVPPPANGRHARAYLDMRGVEEEDPLREKPCVLLLGSEGEGLGQSVLRRADYDVNIPCLGGGDVVDSLNVSVAGALLCSAFMRGRVGEMAKMETELKKKFDLF